MPRPLTLALCLLGLVAAAPAAKAGTYTVYGCRTPDGKRAPTDGWSADRTINAATGQVVNSCSTGGDLRLFLSGDVPAGTETGIKLVPVAPGIELRSGTVWISTAFAPTTTGVFETIQMSAPSAAFSADSFVFTQSATGFGDPNQPLSSANQIPVTAKHFSGPNDGLFGTVRCSGPGNCTSTDGSLTLLLRIHGSAMVVADTAPPTVSRAAGGITTDGATVAPTLSGSVTALVQAADVGSGLRRAVLTVDGTDVTEGAFPDPNGRCSPVAGVDKLAYLYQQPCPPSGTASLSWDTRSVPDGSHLVQLVVEDASGTRTVAVAGQTTLGNGGQIGPGAPDSIRGGPNGNLAVDQAALSVAWPDTARKPSTRPSTVKRCAKDAKYRARHSDACSGKPAATIVKRGWSTQRSVPFAGRLTTTTGAPIAGAVVDVVAVSTDQSATRSALPALTTDADGQFSGTVPRSLGSLRLEVSWRARVHDTIPATGATATLGMAGATTIGAPKRVGRGQRVTFSGKLITRAGTLSQVPVALQVYASRRWRTFSTATTGPDGVWSRRFRFASTPGRYRVRAKVGTSPLYPFEAARSGSEITIRVR